MVNQVKIVNSPKFSQSSAMSLIAGKDVDLLEEDNGEAWEISLILVGFKNNTGKYEKVWIDKRDTVMAIKCPACSVPCSYAWCEFSKGAECE